MPPRFNKARFHVSTGPASLFERVRFKMGDKRVLKLNADHFHDRAFERNAPIKDLSILDSSIWSLITVEVRTDTGKFVSSAWEVTVDDQVWWVVVGLHDTIKTVIPTRSGKLGLGDGIVTGGELYKFVETVNRDLINADLNSSNL